jgi:hypothetical protein
MEESLCRHSYFVTRLVDKECRCQGGWLLLGQAKASEKVDDK